MAARLTHTSIFINTVMVMTVLLIPGRLGWACSCDESLILYFDILDLSSAGIRGYCNFLILLTLLFCLFGLILLPVDCRCEGHKMCDQL